MKSLMDQPYFCSWSGGKDSCLALYYAIKRWGSPKFLFTMVTEDGERVQLHNLPISLVRRQAEALGIPLVVCPSSYDGDDYEAAFTSAMFEFEKQGVQLGVFGDNDFDSTREWIAQVSSKANVEPHFPLWKRERYELLNELIGLRFKAIVIAVERGLLDKKLLGRTIDDELIKEIEDAGVDVLGERGEYHTIVVDGPLFASPIDFVAGGAATYDDYWFLDISPSRA
jgi:diphthine-ammonia ligase